MTNEFIVTLIQNVGFPIVVSLFLLWFCKNTLDKLSDTINELSEIIESNTRALNSLEATCDTIKATIYALPCRTGGECNKNE